MKRNLMFLVVFLLLPILLTSCGNSDTPAMLSSLQKQTYAQSTATTASQEQVQKAYIAYYGRPADPGGLDYWAKRLDATGGNWSSLIEAFGNSSEATALLAGLSNEQKIDKLYTQMFGRVADAAGRAYYANGLANGSFTLASLAVNIINGATGSDATTVANKLAAAQMFTAGLNTDAKIAAYNSTTASTVRNWLALITTTPATQAGVDALINSMTSAATTEACNSLSITPTTNTFPPGIGAGTVTVTANSSCQWTAFSGADWLTSTYFTTSSGGIVNYALSANPSNSSRTGQIFIGLQIFNVTQAAQSCSFSIFPSANFAVSNTGASGSVQVTASSSATGGTASNCVWSAASNVDWISVGVTSGSGNGTVTYSVMANTGSSQRTGTMTIAGQTFTVTQSGAGITGTWNGTEDTPALSSSGCYAATIPFSLTINEDASHAITATMSGSTTTISGSRNGNVITITENTRYGYRGPYTWTWDGANTITGSVAWFCYYLDTGALINEGTATFRVTRN